MYDVRCTRLDVAFAQNITSRFQKNPRDLYWTTVKNILTVFFHTTDAGFLMDADDLKSSDAEILLLMDASKEALGLEILFSGMELSNELGITKGVRHFRAKVHYLREVTKYGDIKLKKVHTDENLADPFTKALAFPKHSEHTRNIGMLPASSLM
ncbi:hypothetical protein Tco_0728498 [Tanacetum coccineum]|uniref:Uncharacterized protein n=1 Tax=Tanacetum coccineum TaxID=301880 RepID=A0ABQ4YM59_9ASTR